MNKIKVFLTKMPGWILTILTVLLILWLTLAPDPLGDDSPQLFPGADKIVHTLMFGFLTVVILLDRERKTEWHPVGKSFAITAGMVSAIFGIAIEFAQRAMDMGRGFEVADMIADCTGAFICTFLWLLSQHRWSNQSF